jgi:hypothetical protein
VGLFRQLSFASPTLAPAALDPRVEGGRRCFRRERHRGLRSRIGALNLSPQQTSSTKDIGSSASARYFHIRAQDRSGNWGATRHYGPVYANTNAVSTYCTSKQNSAGCLPSIIDCSGAYSFNFSTAYLNANGLDAGEVVYCQWWMRDPGSPSTTGLSNALNFTSCP